MTTPQDEDYSKEGAPPGHRLIDGKGIEVIQEGFYLTREGDLMLAIYKPNRLVISIIPQNPKELEFGSPECILNYAEYISRDKIPKIIEERKRRHQEEMSSINAGLELLTKSKKNTTKTLSPRLRRHLEQRKQDCNLSGGQASSL